MATVAYAARGLIIQFHKQANLARSESEKRDVMNVDRAGDWRLELLHRKPLLVTLCRWLPKLPQIFDYGLRALRS